MAKSKKRRPPPRGAKRPGGGAGAPARPKAGEPVAATEAGPAARVGTREDARRERREEARRRREIAYRRARRRATIRRGVTWGVVFAAAAVAVWLLFFQRPKAAREEIDAANAAAVAVGCSRIQDKPDKGQTHLAQGQSFTYDQHPATSGPHDPSPLPPTQHVYPEPVPETRGVHNLEHGYILIYYRADGDQALPDDVVRRLGGFATNHEKAIMAPYPDLPAGAALALAAWDRLQTCPSTVAADDAAQVAKRFFDLFHPGGSASKAPEPNAV